MPRALPILVALVLFASGCVADGGSPSGTTASDAGTSGQAAGVGTATVDGPEPAADRITVVGVGSVAAVPDAARVEVGVEVEGDDVAALYAEAGTALEDMLTALREAGVTDDDLQTTALSVRSRRPPLTTVPADGAAPEPEPVTYVVRSSVEVTVRELDGAGDLVAAALDAGGDAARLDRFTLVVEDDLAPLEQARRRAVDDARRRAEQLADAAGVALGGVVGIRAVGAAGSDPAGEVAADAAGAVPVEPGTQELTVRIVVSFGVGG
ncbi:MAG TPA: SIMPL domain-containing protein [Acidimicrobiales bacterium]|nr:SIMPL domain-containing protein [Acidimicrobiales bacterium]